MIYDSKQWIKDIDQIILTLPELDQLAGKSVLITGATGLICSSVVDIFIRYNETHRNSIQILGAGRHLDKMIARFGQYCNKEYFTFVPFEASKNDNEITLSANYIIHGASNAFPSLIVKEPVETMISNFAGMLFLLEYAKKHNTKRILYVSSSEVYGRKDGMEPYCENEYGYIDLLNPRNSYSIAKRATETLCICYSTEYDVESVIVRPGHIYGPTASLEDNRVSSEFAYAAARGENIIMKSNGMQLRSYCYCLDCAAAILKVLIKGECGNAYNISNSESIITIKQMAEQLAIAGNVKLIQKVANEEEKKGFNPMSNSSLDSTKLEGLGWRGYFSAERGLHHTVQILKDNI